jgi:predicted aminopeptidase
MRAILAGMLLALLAGCESLTYYGQAVGGHLALLGAARPVEDWLADPRTTPELRARLESARRIREFAARRLALPDNGSYRAYAELDRSYVVWNVFATPDLSVTPVPQCFPFAGCVSYRGFFDEARARRHAARLAEAGNDVYVGGVLAYSTLGWFDDPLLSTFIHDPDWQLARLLFHELAHQVLYLKGDTTFNESFAVVVEEEGVRRWLAAEGRAGELPDFLAAQARRRAFAARVQEMRDHLAAIYASARTREEKLEAKRAAFDRLRADYPRFPGAQLNNAFLASVSAYTQRVPEFERLLAESGSLEGFYERMRSLAASGPSSPDPSSPPRR